MDSNGKQEAVLVVIQGASRDLLQKLCLVKEPIGLTRYAITDSVVDLRKGKVLVSSQYKDRFTVGEKVP